MEKKTEGVFEFGHMMERDIDLFLLYSFALDKEFLNLFTDKVEREFENPEVIGVEVSREDHLLGESDVTVYLKDGDYKHAILIEDKINAMAQPDQCARYYQRGNQAVEKGEYDSFDVFICAPSIYIETDSEAIKYEHAVSFEEIEDYLSERDDLFGELRLEEIRYVLYSPKSVYISVPDESATALWMAYQDYVYRNYPELVLCNTVGHKPKGGSWIEYRIPFNNRGKVKLLHKGEKGVLDLQFGGLGNSVEVLSKVLRSQIGDYEEMGLEVVPAGKSAALRKDLGVEKAIDFDRPFESQRDIIEEQVYWINELNSIAKKLDVEEILKLHFEE